MIFRNFNSNALTLYLNIMTEVPLGKVFNFAEYTITVVYFSKQTKVVSDYI